MRRKTVMGFAVLSLFIGATARAENVGMAVPLSGPVAMMGEASRNGLLLFKEQHSGAGGALNVVFEDSKYDGAETISALRKMVDQDHVRFALIWGNTPSAAAAPVARTLNVNSIFLSHDTYSDKSSRAIDLGPTSSSCLGILAEQVRVIGRKKFGTIGIDVGNIIPWLDALDAEMGEKILREIVSSDTSQFQAQLLKGKSRGITTYLLAMFPHQALALAQQAQQLNLKISIIGIDAFADDAFLRKVTKVNSDVRFMSGVTQPWFAEAYRKRFGNSSFLLEAAVGYVAGQVTAHAIEHGATSADLQPSIRSLELKSLPLKNASFSGPGLRISSPCKLYSVDEYLGESTATTKDSKTPSIDNS